MLQSSVQAEEYNPYYGHYIGQVNATTKLIDGLRSGQNNTITFFESLSDDVLTYRYEPSKWTPKEVLLHLIDTERIFTYRALRFARKDTTEIPGFEQDDYVASGNANERSITSLVAEYNHTRSATISLFESMTDEQLKSSGVASNSPMSARAAGFIVCGHEMHHIAIIKERK